MKKGTSFWLKIHFYCGLVASLYLLMIGISALQYNHNFKFLRYNEKGHKNWHKEISYSDTIYNNEVLLKINEELEIFGHLAWWEQYTDSIGNFHYTSSHPCKKYFIEIIKNTRQANVIEYYTGFGALLSGLHVGSSGGPKSVLMTIWKWFANIVTVLSFIAITSGVMLWYKRSFKKKSQWIIVFLIGGLSLFYIFYIWLVG